ncbi:translation initiation factor 3, subunit E [Guillardia theta CCMP2712]|uniref:Eukaryotic translation initiation factor 3 subunit E n=1 Tax=Guillardia theta (strain CCMP2712) TaxID=905079 RepID=L1IEE4_GUITC|nr:translation initiation factor 3, subunit E [Guillardia theta CCMP2712]EKX34646.1 translation initiation factor 3, subunit E [Guillardia theta CCMP2712]|eukprot:XP_005821626.1 translation initiation factor 3, subunit E [Guillardia theta CCMP2712]
MAGLDLVPRMARYLDKHLIFPLLEHVQQQGIYAEEDILKAQFDLLQKTKLIDSAIEKYKAIHKTEDVPEALKNQRQDVVLQLKALKADCKQLLTVIEDPSLSKIKVEGESREKSAQAYREALVSLKEKHNIIPEHVEALYKYAKLYFECGNYGMVEGSDKMGAAEFLPIYRMLTADPNSENAFSALWGKLASEILLGKWEEAADDLRTLREAIDTKHWSNPLQQLEQRTWLVHWSLFVYFKPEASKLSNSRSEVIDLFFSPPYLQTIQTNCSHILRYLAAAVITNPRRRNALKDLVRIIQQEHHTYRDPITEFVECLLVNYDFDSAQEKLRQCEKLLASDYFLQGLSEEFIQNARLFIFETYCRIHQCIDISMLADKLNMGQEEAELWIVNLIRNARLDAKIDSEKHHVIMGSTKPSVYQQVCTKTKSLCFRSYVLAGNFTKQRSKYDREDDM